MKLAQIGSREQDLRPGAQGQRRGFVLLAVLFVLLALFALSAPFLATARNADAASHYAADDAQLRLALEGAARHARMELQGTHPSLDATPYFDALDELDVEIDLPEDFVDPHDPNGVAWDVEASDLSGRIDLGSAPPQVLGNLLGRVARLSRPMSGGDDEIRVSGPDRFPPGSVVSINGELISLGALGDERAIGVAERGIGASQSEDGKWTTTGPSPPTQHGVGAFMFDQRVYAPAIWRTLSVNGEPQAMDTVEEIRACEAFSMSGGFSDAELMTLRRTTRTTSAAGPLWQRGARLRVPLQGGESFAMVVDHGRWFPVGSTVKISGDGNDELRVITQSQSGGRLVLDRPVEFDYQVLESEVSVLVRRPVNVNSAPREVLVALFDNLGLQGQNHRIDAGEAAELAGLIIESRPFTGFEDFVQRVVLPAGGIDALPGSGDQAAAFTGDGAVLDDARDAVALYFNALNANDARLAFSTMPLCFTSDGLFELELRASVHAKSGVERTRGVEVRTELITPQRSELLQIFTRQEDFERSLRLSRNAPYWTTGPNATGRYDSGVHPPSRAIPHLGTLRGSAYIPGISEPVIDADGNPVQAERIFASQSDQDFCQLEPIFVQPNSRTNGRILHFNQESRSLEGRFLPDQAVVRAADDGAVRWADPTASVAQPMSASMWVRPETAGDGTLVSLGGQSPDADRVVCGMSGGNLVLRVFDGMGDHRDTAFQEISEVRFPISPGQGAPGLPTGVWSHVSIDVRGTRPDQMDMLVNGSRSGVQKLGLTRLTSGAGSGGGALIVESTEGFPPACVLRIGSELIEAEVSGPTSFTVRHGETGPNAGFGGRLARVRFDVEGSDTAAPVPIAAAGVTGVYPPGTAVHHYGYSLPLTSGVPSGGSALGGELGPFRVGRVIAQNNDNSLVPIQIQNGQFSIQLGRGWTPEQLGALEIRLADGPDADPTGSEVMQAFHPDGGYALLTGPRLGSVDNVGVTVPIGGAEIVRYSGYTGNQLNIVERGVQFDNGNAPGGTGQGDDLVAKSFVFDWQILFAQRGAPAIPGNEILPASAFLTPISLNARGATQLNFSLPGNGLSQFAQITRMDDPASTEWVRYDFIDTAAGQLVRSDTGTLLTVQNVLHAGTNGRDATSPTGPGGGPGGTPGGNPGGGPGSTTPGGAFLDPDSLPGLGDDSQLARPAPSALLASKAVARSGSDWDPMRGQDLNVDFPLTRAVESVLHFRGVLGTRSASHPAGSPILPVVPIRTSDFDFERGRPGALDPVFVVDGSPTALGFPVTVHRAHYPAPERVVHDYASPNDGQLLAVPGQTVNVPQTGFFVAGTGYVAFQAPVLAPTGPGPGGTNNGGQITDPRFLGRIVKFPSGELPRAVSGAAIGTGAGGLVDFGVPPATVDEVIFGGATAFQNLNGTAPASHTGGSPMLMTGPLSESGTTFTVQPNAVRAADGTQAQPAPITGQLPQSGGLLRIGEEILGYSSVSSSDGRFTVSANGRGLLGTRPQPHSPSESVFWMEDWQVSTLAGDIGPSDGLIPLVSTVDFPMEGTVLIDGELIHYSRIFAGSLAMPRTSEDAGDQDGEGYGAFRGRYGTAPASHAAGTSVIVFPARYWDRYAPRFDGPELGYFGFMVEQPGAFWTGSTWDAQESNFGGAEVVVLQRIGDAPWDADPETTPGLTLMEDGTREGEMVPIGAQADRVEWRVFARYGVGAFDPEFGLSHGWKETPRLIHLGVGYQAPSRVLRSVKR